MPINNETLDFLRGEIEKHISGKRLLHTYAVEREITRLGEIFGFDGEGLFRLRVSALLHDITKEIPTEGQIKLCKEHEIEITADDLKSPKLFHSMTGAYLARSLYPDLVDETVFSAILYHTSGRPNMTLSEKLLYLADYIEETRTFPDCIALREYFYNTNEFTEEHLNKTLLLSYDMTVKNLLDEGKTIHPTTISARNYLIK
jgi:predicted HD superfamily hydrolase involved in NAD metabolism